MKKVIEQGDEYDITINIQEGYVSLSQADDLSIDVVIIRPAYTTEVALAICPELGEPTIKSVTNCPTCGAECEVHGNTTHYYVPKSTLQLRRIEAFEKDKEIEMYKKSISDFALAISKLNNVKSYDVLEKIVLDFFYKIEKILNK